MVPGIIRVFNKRHYPIVIDKVVFPPFEEIEVNLRNQNSYLFYKIRCEKNLVFNKANIEKYKSKYHPGGYEINMVYDSINQHKGNAYTKAIEALANPILKYLPEGMSGYTRNPNVGFNVRFFSSMRINQQGKYRVGPKDIFYSHGIGDKEYWRASRISDYKYAFVPGPTWRDKILNGGWKGDVFIVGYTKLDPLFNGEYERVKSDKPVVVWAPTHGYVHNHKGRSSYPFFKKHLEEISSDYEVRTALHPTSKIKIGHKNPTMQDLIDADIVIADGGSTIYEAWALGKPVLFPDWICKSDMLAHFNEGNLEHNIYKYGIGYHCKNIKDMNKQIEKALVNGQKDDAKEFIESIFPSNLRGRSGETAAKALLFIKDNFHY